MFRWIALVVFVSSLAISTERRIRARRLGGVIPRKAEAPGLIAGRILVALPLFGGMIAYLVHPPAMAWASLATPPWLPWLGVGLGALVVPSVFWVLTALGTNVSETILTKRDHRLVTKGPYRWVRHPLYTTGLALFTSVGLMAANGFVLVCALVALAGVRLFVIPREEAHLLAAFGDDYRQYRQCTGALLPRLSALPVQAMIAFLALPGTVAFVVPLAVIAAGERTSFAAAALIPLGIGVAMLLACVCAFLTAGHGTLAPWAPPLKLVRTGLYRFSRNPMYLGVLLILAGWAIGFRSWPLAGYAAAVAVAFHLRIVFHEEPRLARTFGADWIHYRGGVPRWIGRRDRRMPSGTPEPT